MAAVTFQKLARASSFPFPGPPLEAS